MGAFDSSDPAELMQRGHAACRDGKLEEALGTFERVAALDPANFGAKVAAANCLSDLCRFPEAESRYDDILAAFPENFWALMGLGYWMPQLGRPARRQLSSAGFVLKRTLPGQLRQRQPTCAPKCAQRSMTA
jgi:Flp pilus assembly protein TadD